MALLSVAHNDMTMHIFTDPKELQRQCLFWRREGLRVGLVPTMGYLHAGHMALMERARQLCVV